MVWHQGGLLIRLVADNKGQVELGLRRGSGTREVELERGPRRPGKAGVHRRDPSSNRWNVSRESSLFMLCSPVRGTEKVLS